MELHDALPTFDLVGCVHVPEYSNPPGGVEVFVAYSECNKRNRLAAKMHSGGGGPWEYYGIFSGPPSFLNAKLNDTAQKILGTEAVHTC